MSVKKQVRPGGQAQTRKTSKPTKEIVRPGHEADWMPAGPGRDRIQSRIDGIPLDLNEFEDRDLFGQLRSKRKSAEVINRAIRSLEVDLTNLTTEVFSGRAPIPITPFVILPYNILVASDLEPIDKIVWSIIFKYSQDRTTAWPSERLIADDLNRSIRTVQRSLRNLVKRGYLLIELRKTTGCQFVNQYRFNLQDIRSRTRTKK